MVKLCDLGDDINSTWGGGPDAKASCTLDHVMRRECRLEKLESETNVYVNLTDESLYVLARHCR